MKNYEAAEKKLQKSIDTQVDMVLSNLRSIADSLDIDITHTDEEQYIDYNDMDGGEYYEAPFIINNPTIL